MAMHQWGNRIRGRVVKYTPVVPAPDSVYQGHLINIQDSLSLVTLLAHIRLVDGSVQFEVGAQCLSRSHG